jgi:CheY-like chemotaxis protein
MAAACYTCEWPFCKDIASKQTEFNRGYCLHHYTLVMRNRQYLHDYMERKSHMKILIAEDDPALRELLADLLIAKNHEVVSARDGEEALRIFLNNDSVFDYVITDYQMPRKNGVVLIMNIRRIKSDQKIIMVSGDPPQLSVETRKNTGEFPILQKPYRSADLLALLK